jgi:cell division protein FtsI (penicillin-binding protein 3)
LWGVIIVRAGMLQVVPDSRLENLKRRQFETSIQIRTRRGAILDRAGNDLAASVPAYSLFADPKLIKDPYGLAIQLSKKLKIPVKSLRKRLREKDRRFVWVKRQLDERERDQIKRWDEPGLGFVEEPRRVYPNGSLLEQVLGFVGTEGGGLEGLELQYNKDLQGQLKQVLLPRDARGRPLLNDGRSLTEVNDGADIQLTIDYEVQFNLEQELRETVEKFEADSAVGVVMDAQSSEILALANTELKGRGRRNRVVTDAFEPGSTMKTFVIAGALRENLIRPSTRYNCENGRFKVGDKYIKEAEATEKFSWLNVTEILAKSSNVGATKIGFDLGAARYLQALNDFGFGAKSGVELPGEARGIINPLPWRPHLLANISFGHGIAVTPIQLAAAYGAIANGGILKKPLLVKSIRRAGEERPMEFQAEEVRRVLSAQDAATMRLMLAAATEEGSTGTSARIPGYHVAGKTGTAQKVDTVHGGYIKNAYISSFSGFVPASNPRFVIFVAVDNPKKAYYGSQVSAPVFSRIAQYLVRRAGLPPVLIDESNVIHSRLANEKHRTDLQARAMTEIKRSLANEEAEADVSGGEKSLPNLLGLSLRDALSLVKGQAAKVAVRGSGVVVRTIPAPGSALSPKSRVTLVLENPD